MRDSIAAAISRSNNTSDRQLAFETGFSRSSLGHRRRGRPSRSEGHKDQMALSIAEEESLAAYIGRLCDWNWAPTKAHIRSMAESLIEARGDLPGPNIGKTWVDRFLGRIPELMTTWSSVQSNLRLTASQPERISRWLDCLQKLRSEHNISVDNMWNFDEKGVQAGKAHRRRLIVRRQRLSFDKQRRVPNDRANFTLVECVSAAGKTCRLLVIIPATETQVDWAQDYSVSESKFSTIRFIY